MGSLLRLLRVSAMALIVGVIAASLTQVSRASALDDRSVDSRARAEATLKGRYPNIYRLTCKPDPTSFSVLVENVRYWNRFLCQGATRNAISFSLTYVVRGECDECWTIVKLRGTGVANLRRKANLKPKPNPTPSTSTWWWSEGTANSKLSHSLWITRHTIDPDTVDCGGVGRTWMPQGVTLYQTFRCRMRNAILYDFWYLYRLTVTGRDRFAMKKLASGYGG